MNNQCNHIVGLDKTCGNNLFIYMSGKENFLDGSFVQWFKYCPRCGKLNSGVPKHEDSYQ